MVNVVTYLDVYLRSRSERSSISAQIDIYAYADFHAERMKLYSVGKGLVIEE